jgi:hypothetical protein
MTHQLLLLTTRLYRWHVVELCCATHSLPEGECKHCGCIVNNSTLAFHSLVRCAALCANLLPHLLLRATRTCALQYRYLNNKNMRQCRLQVLQEQQSIAGCDGGNSSNRFSSSM